MSNEKPPQTGIGAMMEMLESAERHRNYSIYHKAHEQAILFGSGFIRIDPQGLASNISIDDVLKTVEFIQEQRVPEAIDPVKTLY